jgi:geranylgeranyl pyrophosphate synthase
LLQEHIYSVFQLINNSWNTAGAWPEIISAMRFMLPEPGDETDSHRDPSRWVILPGLCCQAAGGVLESTLEITAAWTLLYTAAHVVDVIEDGDQDPQINQLGGAGTAINTANGLFLSAVLQLETLHEKDIPGDLAAAITTEFLKTILVMTSGQHRDLISSQVDLNQWWQIAEAKSGEFFSLACKAGARLGTSDVIKVNAFSEYGFHLGLMLQIIDDLEDYQLLLKSEEIVAQINLERSLAVAYAYEVLPTGTKKELAQLIQSASTRTGGVDTLFDILDGCGAGMYMVAEIEKHYDLGIASLHEGSPSSPAKEKLESIIRALKLK